MFVVILEALGAENVVLLMVGKGNVQPLMEPAMMSQSWIDGAHREPSGPVYAENLDGQCKAIEIGCACLHCLQTKLSRQGCRNRAD